MANMPDYISHWDQLFENFQTSPLEFYTAVERAVSQRSLPEVHWTRVEHKEGGLASANRQYLRMHRGKYAFDICAAPFGNNFFVSWWLTEPPLKFGFLYTIAFTIGIVILFNIAYGLCVAVGTSLFGVGLTAVATGFLGYLVTPVILWFIGNGIRAGVISGESLVLATPIYGWIYEKVFAPTTFYSMDTAIMFEKSVHKAVLDVIDCMTAEKGIRGPTDLERKPIMKSMATSA